MVELSEEATEELSAALQDMSEAEEEQHVEEYAEEAETDAEEAEFEEEGYEDEEEYEEYEADEETDVEEGHSVPYSRFSRVIAAKNSAAAEAEELREQIESMQEQFQQMQQMQQTQQQQQYAEPEYETDTEGDPQMNQLHARMHEMAVHQETLTLEREIATVQEEYPDVDPELLLNAVIQDPHVDIAEVAEAYTNQLAEIEEAAINNFLANLDLDDADDESDDIPPEVASTRGRQRTLSSARGNKPNTMEQAHEALSEWLQSQD